MKKIILTVSAAIITLSATAQPLQQVKDWAQFNRYAQANDELTQAPLAVLFGDSITDNWAVQRPEFFSSNNFAGRGISGQTTSEMLVRFRQDVISLHPRVVVILAGTNDVAQNNGFIKFEDAVGNILSMCELARAHGILPVICSVPPSNRFFWKPGATPAQDIIRFNGILKTAADNAGLIYVDYHSAMTAPDGSFPAEYSKDGCHPIAAGYEKMEGILLPYIHLALESLK